MSGALHLRLYVLLEPFGALVGRIDHPSELLGDLTLFMRRVLRELERDAAATAAFAAKTWRRSRRRMQPRWSADSNGPIGCTLRAHLPRCQRLPRCMSRGHVGVRPASGQRRGERPSADAGYHSRGEVIEHTIPPHV
jgi:hypothetical protein